MAQGPAEFTWELVAGPDGTMRYRRTLVETGLIEGWVISNPDGFAAVAFKGTEYKHLGTYTTAEAAKRAVDWKVCPSRVEGSPLFIGKRLIWRQISTYSWACIDEETRQMVGGVSACKDGDLDCFRATVWNGETYTPIGIFIDIGAANNAVEADVAMAEEQG